MFPRATRHKTPKSAHETGGLQRRQQTREDSSHGPPTEACRSLATGVLVLSASTPSLSSFGVDGRKIDQIRMTHKCDIVYDDRLQGFRISCTVEKSCSELVQRTIKALKAVRSQSLSELAQGLRAYLVYPSPQILGPHVVKITNLDSSKLSLEAAGMKGGAEMVAQLVPATTTMGASDCEINDGMQALRRKTPKHLALAVVSSLERLRYCRGRVRILDLLGNFNFNRYQKSFSTSTLKADDCEPALEFINLMRSANTQGGLYRLKPEARLLERVQQCKELFEVTENQSINDVNPYHTGVWTFPSNNKADNAEVQLRVVTGPNEGPGRPLRTEKSEWNASSEDQSVQALELYVTNLLPELAWKLEIATQKCERTISRELLTFSQAVHILQPTSRVAQVHNGELMFHWSGAKARPKRFNQKTTWRYRLRENPNLIFEVSRVDEFDLERIFKPKRIEHFLSPEARKPDRTEWEACIFDNQWDEYLGQNLTLKTGDSASWDPSIETFFPPQTNNPEHFDYASGFEAFMHIVQDVAGRLSRVAL